MEINFNKDIQQQNNINIHYNVFQNINSLDSKEKDIILHSLTNQEKNNIILKHEIINLINNSEINYPENFKSIVRYFFNRYSYTIGGNLFNFKKWICRLEDDNYFIFSNIIHKDNYNDTNTVFFLENMQKLFKKILSKYSCNLSSKFLERDNMYIVFFIFVLN